MDDSADLAEQTCDLCDEPPFQVIADATKDPVEYSYYCEAHMKREGPFPVDQQKGLEG